MWTELSASSGAVARPRTTPFAPATGVCCDTGRYPSVVSGQTSTVGGLHGIRGHGVIPHFDRLADHSTWISKGTLPAAITEPATTKAVKGSPVRSPAQPPVRGPKI